MLWEVRGRTIRENYMETGGTVSFREVKTNMSLRTNKGRDVELELFRG